MTTAGAVVVVAAVVVAITASILFFRISQGSGPGRNPSTRADARRKVVAIVVVGLLLGAAIGLARAFGG